MSDERKCAIKEELSRLSKIFFCKIRIFVFYLQDSEKSNPSIEQLNDFCNKEDIFHIQLCNFKDNELYFINDYKLWTRHNILSGILEEISTLFKIYRYWLNNLNRGDCIMTPQDWNGIKSILTKQQKIEKVISGLESVSKTIIDTEFKGFLINLNELRNSLIHHRGFSIKGDIKLSYKAIVPIISDGKNAMAELKRSHKGQKLSNAFPNLSPDEDGNFYSGVKQKPGVITIIEDEFINISYSQIKDIILYLCHNMKKAISDILNIL